MYITPSDFEDVYDWDALDDNVDEDFEDYEKRKYIDAIVCFLRDKEEPEEPYMFSEEEGPMVITPSFFHLYKYYSYWLKSRSIIGVDIIGNTFNEEHGYATCYDFVFIVQAEDGSTETIYAHQNMVSRECAGIIANRLFKTYILDRGPDRDYEDFDDWYEEQLA